MMTTNMMKQSWKQTENETENDKRDQSAGVEQTKEIPEFTIERKVAGCHGQTQKEKQETATASEPATKRKRNGEADLQRNAKTKRMHTRSMAKNKNKSDKQKSDAEEAGHRRPTCTLPALYKLCSTLLFNKLYSRLDHGHPDDQGGFRRSFQTLDHLATYKLLE